MKLLFCHILVFFSCVIASSQEVDLKFEVKNYDQDALIIGYYYGDRQLVLDTLTKNKKGIFQYQQDTLLEGGVYLAIFQPDNTFMQFVLNRVEKQSFYVELDKEDLSRPLFKGSEDNKIFYDYLEFLKQQRERNQVLQKEKDSLALNMIPIEAIEEKMRKVNDEVMQYQQNMVEKNPQYISSKLIRTNFEIKIPEFTGDEKEIRQQRYLYYKKHYFDYLELGDPDFLRTPMIDQRIKYYMESLTPQTVDSIKKSLDYLLGKLEPAPESYRFYLSSFINEYAASKIVGFDAVYVHLALNYYGKGKAPWMDEENLTEMLGNAKALEPILVGKKAPDLTVYRRDGSTVQLSKIDAQFTVLLFWAHDCGHCKKSMPQVIEFYEKYKTKGVEILGICTKHRDEAKKCWEFIDEREGMDGWINANDPFHKSGFRFKYKVESTPQIFVLDKDQNIVVKRIGAEQLDEVMEELFSIEEKKVIEGK